MFRWMPDRFPFSVPGGLFVRRPSFPFRFRPSLPGLLFRIVVSLVFGQPVGAPSFPCLPGFHLIYMRCFHVWLLVRLPCFPCVCPLFLCLLLFAILAVPSMFSVPIRSVVPLRLPYFPCVCLCSCCIRLSCLGASSFLQPLPLPYLSFLCVRLLTHALYFPCVSFVPNSLSSCCSLPSFLSPSLGFPFPLMRVFSLVAPTFPVLFPPFPVAFPSSSSFVPAFSFPYSPLLSSPSFSIKKKVPS